MGLLINNDLIWLCIPKNASFSIQHAIENSGLQIEYHSIYKKKLIYKEVEKYSHIHIQKKFLHMEWGNKETICINRNYVDRFISAIEFIWAKIEKNGHTPIIPINEVDNNFLYNIMDESFLYKLYYDTSLNNILFFDLYQTLIKEKLNINNTPHYIYKNFSTLHCQNFYKNGEKCTYEFDIKELDKFENFIKNKYNIKISIPILNKNPNPNKTKLIKNDKFKNWIYNKFESQWDNKIKKIL